MSIPIINPPGGAFGVPQIDALKIKRKFLDVPYASQSPNQLLDIFLPPEGDGPFPTIIYVHGGGFYLGDKRDAQLHSPFEGINRGYAVASVRYRLAGEAKFPAGLFDVKAAIRFLRANVSKFRLDGDRFASCGDSAGGYYVVMAAATQDNKAFEDFTSGNACYSSAVQTLVSWFGVFDIVAHARDTKKDEDSSPAISDIGRIWLGAPVDDISGLAYFTNPMNFITAGFPPVYLLHGTNDSVVPVSQTCQLEARVRQLCGAERVKMELMDGYQHGGFESRWNNADNIDKVYAFLDKHLK